MFEIVCVCPARQLPSYRRPHPPRYVEMGSGCLPLLAAALILSAVAQARAPERRGRQVVRAAYHRRRRRSAQRPGRAAAVQRGRYPRIAFYGYAR